MAYEAKDLAAVIVGQSPLAAGMKASAVAGAAASPVTDFCTAWTTAKPVLTALSALAIFIPGAGAILQGLIKVGDQLASDLCGK